MLTHPVWSNLYFDVNSKYQNSNLQFHLASMPNGAWVVHILPCEKLEPKSLSHFIHSVFSSENCLAFFSAMDASINLPDCVAALLRSSVTRIYTIVEFFSTILPKIFVMKIYDNVFWCMIFPFIIHFGQFLQFFSTILQKNSIISKNDLVTLLRSSLCLLCQQHEKRDRSNGRSPSTKVVPMKASFPITIWKPWTIWAFHKLYVI